jgi:sugar lactone lactonase YvrE
MPIEVKPSGQLRMELGEGPVWNDSTGRLTVVDVFGRKVHYLVPGATGWRLEKTIPTVSDVGAALTLDSGELLTCEQAGIFLHGTAGSELVATLPVSGDEYRANDAKLSPDGRLFIGVMNYEATPGCGSLWAVDRAGRSTLLLEGLCIPNGMDWWGNEFWFVDGPSPEIRCYETLDHELLDIGKVISTRGIPDGLSIDGAGNVWVALWGEGRVDCISRSGDLLDSIVLPAPHTTSVAFVGPDRRELAVTTAQFGLSDDQLAHFPHSGDVFFTQVRATGSQSFQRLA